MFRVRVLRFTMTLACPVPFLSTLRHPTLADPVVRDAQSELKTLRREFDEMKIIVEKLSSDVERFRLLSSEKLEEIVAPRLDTAVKIMMHELECFDRRTNERIDSVATRCRESLEDVSDRMRIRMTEHDESIGAIFAANNKLAKCIDVHIEEFRKELYHSLERTKSSEEMRDSQLRDLMKRFDEYVAQQNVRMQKFAVDSVAAVRLRQGFLTHVLLQSPLSIHSSLTWRGMMACFLIPILTVIMSLT